MAASKRVPDALPRVICLAGPTGSGKTALALNLARIFDCEIVNTDSRQVYRDFPLITAQPEAELKAQLPHHLYGYLESSRKISAGQWLGLALKAVQAISSRGRIALLVGGTGLYFDAMLKGLAVIPPVPDVISREYEARMQSEGPELLYQLLRELDPGYAVKIHPHDKQRIQRALEVLQATGRPFSWWHEHARPVPAARGPLLALDITLDKLEPRLGRRIDLMLAAGAYEEACRAWRNCPDESAPAWSGIGCAELLACLRGEIDLAECKRVWLANTRAYAKRQLTWFRAKKNAIWIKPDDQAAFGRAIKGWLEEEPE